MCTMMLKMCFDATSPWEVDFKLWARCAYMCIEAASYLQIARCLFLWSSRLQGALARTRCRLVAATMGANVQRVLLANLGSLLLANSAYSTDCVKGIAKSRKEVDHCILPAYYFYYGCDYFYANNACFSLSLWGLIYLIAMFAFGVWLVQVQVPWGD